MTESLVKTSLDDSIYTITLARPEKRNAVSDRLLGAGASLDRHPGSTRVIILAAEGKHFCAGLDLTEHQNRDPFGVMQHSQAGTASSTACRTAASRWSPPCRAR